MRESSHLQREAEAQRAGLANTLGQLRQGVTGQAISNEISGVVRDASLSLVKSFAESARSNPGAALLIGAGLTMMLTRTSGSDVMSVANSAIRAAASAGGSVAGSVAGTVADTARSVAGQASEKLGGAAGSVAGQVKGAVSGIANTVSATAGSANGAASGASAVAQGAIDEVRRTVHDGMAGAESLMKEGGQRVHELQDEAGRLAADTQQAMKKLFEEQPILVAALGTALGALIGAALPVSQAERQVLGKTGAQALDAGREAMDKAKSAVVEELDKAKATIGHQVEEAQLGQKAAEAAGRLVDAMVPVSPKS